MPPGTARRTGNHHTAQRWAGFLRQCGHRVGIEEAWGGGGVDALIALHARKSAASVEKFHREHADRPLIVALTGTDLYRDLETSSEAQRSLELASRLVVLQPQARKRVAPALREKMRVIFQSSDTRLSHRPPADRFRIAVVGNLREEKDPFRAAAALAHLSTPMHVEVVQVGAALSPEMAEAARTLQRHEPRYTWIGSRTHEQALRQIAQSHLLVVSSVMEGGANVICEASRIGVPVLASRIDGNVGMLGTAYPGYFPVFDERKLARLIDRASTDRVFYGELKAAVGARRALFAPSAEREGLRKLLDEFSRG